MLKGACNCGQVAFTIQADQADIYQCHCSICRRASGVFGMAVLVIPKQQLAWVSGQDNISTWRKPGHHWQTWFCQTCGSTVPGHNDDARYFVPAGLITTGIKHLKVAHHIFVDSKAPWHQIADDGKQHPEGFTG